MDENVSKGFHLGGGVMMTMAVLAIAVTMVLIGIGIARNGSAKSSTMANDLANQIYTQYDNTSVSGDTILSLIKQYESEEISIVVNVGGSSQDFIYHSDGASTEGYATLGEQLTHDEETEALKNAKDKTSENYISPTKKFTCVVCKNENTDAITAMYFTSETE